MKRIISIFICLLLLTNIFCSCNKKPDIEEEYITFDNENIINQQDDENIDTSQDEKVELQEDEQENSIKDGTDEIYRIFERCPDTKDEWSGLEHPFFTYSNFDGLIFATFKTTWQRVKEFEYNSFLYWRYCDDYISEDFPNGVVQFPVGTIYENVNIEEFKTTGQFVEVTVQTKLEHYIAEMENEKIWKHDVEYEQQTVELCQMPEHMKNDKYINMQVVKTADGKFEMYYGHKSDGFNDKTYYSYLERENRLRMVDGLDVNKIDAVKITYEENDTHKSKIINDHKILTEFYECISVQPIVDTEEWGERYPKEDATAVEVKFKNDTGVTIFYFPKKNKMGSLGYSFMETDMWSSGSATSTNVLCECTDEFTSLIKEMIIMK